MTAALLPEWVARPDGTAVEYSGWGEASPEELDALLEDCCREVPQVLLGGLSHRVGGSSRRKTPCCGQ